MLAKTARRVFCTLIILSLVLVGLPTSIAHASSVLTLSGTSDSSKLLNLSGDYKIKVIGSNTIGAIQCSGDLVIEGDGSSSLTVVNTSHSSSYMADKPGIVANGSIKVDSVNLTDQSKGTAIADASGASGGIEITDSTVTVKNSGFNRLYGIRSVDGIDISNSTVSIESIYKEAGIFAFDDIDITSSTVSVAASGKYTLASVSSINFSSQKVTVPSLGSIETVRDTLMFPGGKNIQTIVSGSRSGYKGNVLIEKVIAPPSSMTTGSSSVVVPSSITTGSSLITTGSSLVVAVPSSTPASTTSSNSSSSTGSSYSGGSSSGGSSAGGSGGGSSAAGGDGGSSTAASSDTVDPSAKPIIKENVEEDEPLPTLKPDDLEPQGDSEDPAVEEVDENTIKVTQVAEDGTTIKILLTEDTLTYTNEAADGTANLEAFYNIKSNDRLELASWSASSASISIPMSIEVDGEVYTVTSIKASAFVKNKSIEKITISSSITVLGEKVFYSCSNLKTVVIKGNIKKVGADAFKKIDKKAVIYIKASMKTFRNIKKRIKASGVANTVKFKRM